MKLMINLLSWKFFAFISIVGIIYYFIFCFSLFPYEDSEILRINSPDGKADAVHIVRDRGAMGPTWNLVYIVPAGQEIKKEYKEEYFVVFRANGALNLKYEWENAGNLIIQFKGDIAHFKNYIYPFKLSKDFNKVRLSDQVIAIKLEPEKNK